MLGIEEEAHIDACEVAVILKSSLSTSQMLCFLKMSSLEKVRVRSAQQGGVGGEPPPMCALPPPSSLTLPLEPPITKSSLNQPEHDVNG